MKNSKKTRAERRRAAQENSTGKSFSRALLIVVVIAILTFGMFMLITTTKDSEKRAEHTTPNRVSLERESTIHSKLPDRFFESGAEPWIERLGIVVQKEEMRISISEQGKDLLYKEDMQIILALMLSFLMDSHPSEEVRNGYLELLTDNRLHIVYGDINALTSVIPVAHGEDALALTLSPLFLMNWSESDRMWYYTLHHEYQHVKIWLDDHVSVEQYSILASYDDLENEELMKKRLFHELDCHLASCRWAVAEGWGTEDIRTNYVNVYLQGGVSALAYETLRIYKDHQGYVEHQEKLQQWIDDWIQEVSDQEVSVD
ncbi:hypothetical protein ACFL1U_03040 [Patescibacteria group bacterium]